MSKCLQLIGPWIKGTHGQDFSDMRFCSSENRNFECKILKTNPTIKIQTITDILLTSITLL